MQRTQPTLLSRSPTLQPDQLRNAQSRRIQHLQHRPVPQADRGLARPADSAVSRRPPSCKYPGSDRRIFGDSRLIDGSAAIKSCICANRKKFRSVTRLRATVRLSSCSRYSPARKSTKSSRVTASSVSFLFFANASNFARSRLIRRNRVGRKPLLHLHVGHRTTKWPPKFPYVMPLRTSRRREPIAQSRCRKLSSISRHRKMPGHRQIQTRRAAQTAARNTSNCTKNRECIVNCV